MLQIVRSIYKMTGQMVRLPEDEDTPEKVSTEALPCTFPQVIVVLMKCSACFQRVDKIFRNMDLNKDARLTFDEFKEGSKQDPTIVQVTTGLVLGHEGRLLMNAGIVVIRWIGLAILTRKETACVGWRRGSEGEHHTYCTTTHQNMHRNIALAVRVDSCSFAYGVVSYSMFDNATRYLFLLAVHAISCLLYSPNTFSRKSTPSSTRAADTPSVSRIRLTGLTIVISSSVILSAGQLAIIPLIVLMRTPDICGSPSSPVCPRGW